MPQKSSHAMLTSFAFKNDLEFDNFIDHNLQLKATYNDMRFCFVFDLLCAYDSTDPHN